MIQQKDPQVTYNISKHHSVTPCWLRSSPYEINVPVVGSRLAVPILTRYLYRNRAGRNVAT